jgi:uncharacterized membrane protein YtjA (UPF0391 family)
MTFAVSDEPEVDMLRLAVTFFVTGLTAALLGLTGIVGLTADVLGYTGIAGAALGALKVASLFVLLFVIYRVLRATATKKIAA